MISLTISFLFTCEEIARCYSYFASNIISMKFPAKYEDPTIEEPSGTPTTPPAPEPFFSQTPSLADVAGQPGPCLPCVRSPSDTLRPDDRSRKVPTTGFESLLSFAASDPSGSGPRPSTSCPGTKLSRAQRPAVTCRANAYRISAKRPRTSLFSYGALQARTWAFTPQAELWRQDFRRNHQLRIALDRHRNSSLYADARRVTRNRFEEFVAVSPSPSWTRQDRRMFLSDVSIPGNLVVIRLPNGGLDLALDIPADPSSRASTHSRRRLPRFPHCTYKCPAPPIPRNRYNHDDRATSWPSARQHQPHPFASFTDMDLGRPWDQRFYSTLPYHPPRQVETRSLYDWLFPPANSPYRRLHRDCEVTPLMAALALESSLLPDFCLYGYGFPQAKDPRTFAATVLTSLLVSDEDLYDRLVTVTDVQRLLDQIAMDRARFQSRLPFLRSLSTSREFELPLTSRALPQNYCRPCRSAIRPRKVVRHEDFFRENCFAQAPRHARGQRLLRRPAVYNELLPLCFLPVRDLPHPAYDLEGQ